MDKSTAKMLARAEPVLARLPDDRPLVLVEVGVNRGQLAEHLLRERQNLEWHGVDPWRAPEHNTPAYVRTHDGHATQSFAVSERCYGETMRRVAAFGSRASVHRMASPFAASCFADETADAVFIDADHSYDAVKDDIEAWWPVVKPGGWLGGHDYAMPDPRFDFSGVDRAVNEFVAAHGLSLEVDEGATWFVRKPA